MYSSSRSRSSQSSPRSGSSDRKPYERKTFDRKPYAGKPRTDRDTRGPRTERGPDPKQMRYQVIGRTTDESDLIVQISPAFYEQVRAAAHQKPMRPSRGDDSQSSQPRYGKFNHPFHKEPMMTSYNKKGRSDPWDAGTIDLGEIDSEMDSEYDMIKKGFADLDQKKTGYPKKPTTKRNFTPRDKRK